MGCLLKGIGALLLVALVLFGALLGGLGPLEYLPGGVLWGPVREAPEDWSFTNAVAQVELQTHVGPLPWAVTTWVMADGADLFIGASECERIWTHRVMEDPEVRVRIEGDVYELRARLVEDRAVTARIAPILLSKYLGITADSANWIEGRSTGCVFQLEPRS